MSEGSIGYYSGSSVLTELTAGSESSVLTMGATNPAWVSASGAVFDKIAEQTTAGTSIDTTALSDCATYERLLFQFAFECDADEPLDFQFYDGDGTGEFSLNELMTNYYQLSGFTNGALFNLSPTSASLRLSNGVNIGNEACGGYIELVNKSLVGGMGAFGRASWYSDLNGGMCAFDNKGYGALNSRAVRGFKLISPTSIDNAFFSLWGSS